MLARYAGVEPGNLRFAVGQHGKPYLLGARRALDFNLSHSGEWLACVVTAGIPVGVDLEACEPTRRVMTLARRFFREEEVAALADCCDASKRDRFYDFWTLKEAAVKARGSMLVSGLDSRGFALAFDSDGVSAWGHIAVTTPDNATAAQYCLLDLLSGYRLAICWLPALPLQPRLQAFELFESGDSRTCDLPLRASTWRASSIMTPTTTGKCRLS